MSRAVTLVLVALAAGVVSAAQPQSTERVVTRLDERYASIEGVDPSLLLLDVHAPKDAKGLPVMIFLHGGGWRRGDKAGEGALSHAAFFNTHGWIYISVNYRLSPAVMHPAHCEDVAKALAFIARHVAEWGGDVKRLHLSGHSAGAHLASLVALNDRFLKAQGLSPAMLRGVVLLDTAAYDLEAIMRKNPPEMTPYPAAFGKDPAVWRDASPLAQVAAGRGTPPMLLVVAFGGEDKGVRAETLVEKLRGIGTRADILDASVLRHHGSLNKEFGAADDPVAPKVLAFLESLETAKPGVTGTTEALKVDADVAARAAEAGRTARAGLLIKRSDKNGDRRWSRDEAPANYQHRFDELDRNKDGFLDAREVGAAMAEAPRRAGAKAAEKPAAPPLEQDERDQKDGAP
jgi:acetyl esterase/lipase